MEVRSVATSKWSVHPAIVAAIGINAAILVLAIAWSGNAGRMSLLLHEDGIVEWMQFLCFAATSGLLAFLAVEQWQRTPGRPSTRSPGPSRRR